MLKQGEILVSHKYAVLFLTLTLAVAACDREPHQAPAPTKLEGPKVAAALPNNGFKAQLSLTAAPTKLRTGERSTVEVHVKNLSDVIWYARGGEINSYPDNRFYLAVGDRWLQSDGKLLTNMDGRYGLDRDLKPGEETKLPLLVTAPSTPGEYQLEVDLVQEQVSWFSDKGSQSAKTKVTVVR
jgi:hypothetical protein